ncbi:hypothetical protein DAPPUDRAFT_233812 [Daphnia pulex]|uniref:Uncharacterized protein n=1 Tax=Daphnia pulex TaxID=6669 RepID=E9FVT4_DAPPU|nr:hypothetical protein DAPPUDRAFT_233812 [Daphnia pulex]|eukprot:EFX89049.1 hypothetical protein DAPPUDRAFT_233812 [Daphnia pulex]
MAGGSSIRCYAQTDRKNNLLASGDKTTGDEAIIASRKINNFRLEIEKIQRINKIMDEH